MFITFIKKVVYNKNKNKNFTETLVPKKTTT